MVGTICESPVEKQKSYKAEIAVEAIRDDNFFQITEGKALLYFEKDSASAILKTGDRIVFEPSFSEIQNTGNPNEFDYKKYLSYHDIFHQGYIRTSSWHLIDENKGNLFLQWAEDIRTSLLKIYSDNGITGEEFAVLSALTLGYKDKLEEETRKAYSSSGALHILAVSGLHVGVIYLIMTYFLFFMKRKTVLRILRAVILLICLWGFALITGLSPSVMRAATMFSFIVIGDAFKRKPDIYNSIAGSAVFLLILDPYSIMSAGFQLSYLAVIGIVFFQPRIYKLLYIKNKLLDKIWILVSVSIAAQLGTFPVSVHYFNQFPNYFILTNILVIPFASILIYMAVILFAFSWAGPVATFLASLLKYTVLALNSVVKWIEALPHAVTENLYLDVFQVAVIYLMLFTLAFFLIMKKPAFLFSFLFLSVLLLVEIIVKKTDHLSSERIIVYNIKGRSAYNFIDGDYNLLFYSIDTADNSSNAEKIIESNWLKEGLNRERVIYTDFLRSDNTLSKFIGMGNPQLCVRNGFIQFGNYRILVVDKYFKANSSKDGPIGVDVVIIRDNPKISSAELLGCVKPGIIIFDSSNTRYYTGKCSESFVKEGLRVHDVTTDGAFIVDNIR